MKLKNSDRLADRLMELHKSSAGECGDAYYTAISADVTAFAGTAQATPAKYPGVIAAEFNKPSVQRSLRALEPGTVRLPGNTLIVQGADDTTVLPETTIALKNLMSSKNSRVTLNVYPGAGHTSVLMVAQAQKDMTSHLMTIFQP